MDDSNVMNICLNEMWEMYQQYIPNYDAVTVIYTMYIYFLIP